MERSAFTYLCFSDCCLLLDAIHEFNYIANELNAAGLLPSRSDARN